MSPDPDPTAPFEAGARGVLTGVRGAYGELLEALGQPPRAAEVQSALGLDKKLAWRIHKVARAVDPIEGAPHVPSQVSARRVAKAAQQRGVDGSVAAAILAATESFDRFVAERAEDRPAFEAMAAAVAGRGLDPILLDARRAAFRANVLLHGKLSETLLYALILGASPRPEQLTAVSLRGHLGMQRLRPNASVELGRHRFDTDGRPLGGSQPLDPATAAALHAPLVSAFSSADPGDLSHVELPNGFRRTFLSSPELGTRGARTYVLGEWTDSMPRDEHALGSLCEIATPTKRLVHDFLVHEGIGVAAPEVRVVSSRSGTESWPAPDDPGVIPIGCAVADLGTGLESAALPGWSAHAELLRFGAGAAGLDVARLRHFRVVVDHPVQGSVVWLRAPTR